jgi:hypothetical protein
MTSDERAKSFHVSSMVLMSNGTPDPQLWPINKGLEGVATVLVNRC